MTSVTAVAVKTAKTNDGGLNPNSVVFSVAGVR